MSRFLVISHIRQTGTISSVLRACPAKALVLALLIYPQQKVAASSIAGPAIRFRCGIGQSHERAHVIDETAALDASGLVTNAFSKTADGRLIPELVDAP